jgi:hypothetical protein
MKSAEELIKSQTTTVFKEVVNGKLTGKSVNRKLMVVQLGPGDKTVLINSTGFVDIVSTKEFNNQMPNRNY